MHAGLAGLACALILACSESHATGTQPQATKLHPDLVAHLGQLQDSQYVSVVFHYDEASQLSQAQRYAIVADAEGSTPRERRQDGRQALILALKQEAERTQGELLSGLDAGLASGAVRKLRRLWLSNAIGCELTKGYLNQVALNPSAMSRIADEGVRLDLPRRVSIGADPPPALDSVGWGVEKIGADTVSGGLEGAGVLVAVIDLGFNSFQLHPDIQTRYWTNEGEESDGVAGISAADADGNDQDHLPDDLNDYVDDLWGWDFHEKDNDISSTNPHGMGVAGIVAGTGDGGTRTGVAPGAQLMLLRVGSELVTSTEQEVWEAVQYAANRNADIVNLSLGWKKNDSPDFASWRDWIDKLTNELGILVVTGSGNNADTYPKPYSITTPGTVPSALTVGATDSDDLLWLDTAYYQGSNTGPVSWQDIPPYEDFPFSDVPPYAPGLMKPDVVAPGKSVESLYQSSTYKEFTGTSFAAPHATGLAALLLEADPNLGPHELRFLIEETALELPLPGTLPTPSELIGPDSTFGWGRIDVNAAVSALPIDSTAYDLSITGTNAEWTSVDIWVDNDGDGTEDTPVAETVNRLYGRVRNLGGQVAGNVELHFYYEDVATNGIGGFDPDGDGNPADGSFKYIGKYVVPLLGPAGSDHDEATGVVDWEIPLPTSDHWCVGVAALVNLPGANEADLSNNRAFRNFFELVVMTSANLEFRLKPPPPSRDGGDDDEADEAFDLVLQRRKLPPRVRLFLRVADEHAGAFAAALAELPPPPREAEEREKREPGFTWIPLRGSEARLRDVRLPGGEPIPVSLAVRVPPDVILPREPMVVLSVHDADDVPAGGLTVKLVRPTARQRGGPYHPRNPR